METWVGPGNELYTTPIFVGYEHMSDKYSFPHFIGLLCVSPAVLFQSSRVGLRVGDLFGDPQILEMR